MKRFGIDRVSIDSYVWEVQKALIRYGLSVDESEIAVYPLQWYVCTGRASVAFLHKMVETKPFLVARRLRNGGSHDEMLDRVRKLIAA